jgi:hypothetical protein
VEHNLFFYISKIGLFKRLIFPFISLIEIDYIRVIKMSKIFKWQYNDFFQDRRMKLINILLSEVIFLKNHYNMSENALEKGHIQEALEKLEYLLEILKNNETCLSDADFDKIVNFIYQIFNNIAKKLEK